MPRSAEPLSKIQRLIQKLSLEHKQALMLWLTKLIEQELLPPDDVPAHPNREVVEQLQQGRVTYQLERVKCGKQACRCNRGQLHGPYWYGYQRKAGKLSSWYIGKEFKTKPE